MKMSKGKKRSSNKYMDPIKHIMCLCENRQCYGAGRVLSVKIISLFYFSQLLVYLCEVASFQNNYGGDILCYPPTKSM